MILSVINTGLIVFIIAAIIVNSIYLYKLKKDHENQIKAFIEVQKQVNGIIERGMSFLDIAEFKVLDPRIKDMYRTYVVSQIMPALMDVINRRAESENLYDYVATHRDEIDKHIAMIIQQIYSKDNVDKSNGLLESQLDTPSSGTIDTPSSGTIDTPSFGTAYTASSQTPALSTHSSTPGFASSTFTPTTITQSQIASTSPISYNSQYSIPFNG